METIGNYLKQQREKAGVSLEQIASATRIRTSLLQSIEADRLDACPQGVFLRGFVRSYMEHLKQPAERALEVLDTQTSPSSLASPFSGVPMNETEAPGHRFKVAHLLVLVFALLAMLSAYFLTSTAGETGRTVTSMESTDADSGTTRTFSPVDSGK
jgi:cytoskeletal protein RodZ